MTVKNWLEEMSSFEPMVLQFLDARREALMQLVVTVAREAEQAVGAVKTSYNDLIEMVQEVDRNASEWVETNFEDAPAVLMVAVMVFMAVTVLAVVWGKETLEQETEEDLKIIEEERTMDDNMLELIKSKLILTKQLDDIAIIQDEARKEVNRLANNALIVIYTWITQTFGGDISVDVFQVPPSLMSKRIAQVGTAHATSYRLSLNTKPETFSTRIQYLLPSHDGYRLE